MPAVDPDVEQGAVQYILDYTRLLLILPEGERGEGDLLLLGMMVEEKREATDHSRWYPKVYIHE